MLTWPDKDPDAELDYTVDWSAELVAGDPIATAEWIVPDGITQMDGRDSQTDTTATLWLSGGTPGAVLVIVSRITTAAGRKDDRSVKIKIKPQ